MSKIRFSEIVLEKNKRWVLGEGVMQTIRAYLS